MSAVETETAVTPEKPRDAVTTWAFRAMAHIKDGRLAIEVPELAEGQAVEVIVLPTEEAEQGRAAQEPKPQKRSSLLDIIESLDGHRIFKSAAEVDAYIERERASWDEPIKP